jgi:hypothetical protein
MLSHINLNALNVKITEQKNYDGMICEVPKPTEWGRFRLKILEETKF